LRQSLAAGESGLEIALERRGCFAALDYDQIVILPFFAGSRKVRGARAKQSAVNLIAFEVHRRTVVAFGANLNAGRLGKVLKDLSRLAFGELRSVEIDAHIDAAIGGILRRDIERALDELISNEEGSSLMRFVSPCCP
jgi:hypothetical protein